MQYLQNYQNLQYLKSYNAKYKTMHPIIYTNIHAYIITDTNRQNTYTKMNFIIWIISSSIYLTTILMPIVVEQSWYNSFNVSIFPFSLQHSSLMSFQIAQSLIMCCMLHFVCPQLQLLVLLNIFCWNSGSASCSVFILLRQKCCC